MPLCGNFILPKARIVPNLYSNLCRVHRLEDLYRELFVQDIALTNIKPTLWNQTNSVNIAEGLLTSTQVDFGRNFS